MPLERTRKCIALIAHDNKKPDLAEWALFNREVMAHADLVATGTTGLVLAEQLGLPVERVHSGPLGGDQQIGAMIAEGRYRAPDTGRRCRVIGRCGRTAS